MKRKFSLLEILIATTILVILGLLLVGLIRQCLRVYQQAEARRQQYQDVQMLHELLREDVFHLVSQEPDISTQSRTTFLSNFHPLEPTIRVFFMRNLQEEQADPVLRQAGNGAFEEGWDSVYTLKPTPEEKLRSPGGVAEIFYVLGNDETLYRGFRSPVGGKESWEGVYDQDFSKIQKRCQPVCRRVLYFGAKFCGPQTSSWDTSLPPLAGGPHLIWDSTRSLLKDFYYYRKNTHEPFPEIFPKKIQFLLILASAPPYRTETSLRAAIGAKDLFVPVESTERFNVPQEGSCFIRVHQEWMEVQSVEATSFIIKKRGALGTKAIAHQTTRNVELPGGLLQLSKTSVVQGIAFPMTFHVPTYQLKLD
ncbi:MAG: hypothetical protein AABZ60_21235 [Planctomycetota bacterium]